MEQPTFSVAEWFVSINGEGTRAGELAVFIRLCGCNLHCSYCDTLWANQKDTPHTQKTAEQLRQLVLETGVRNVTLTGGEPLLHPHVDALLACLLQDDALRVEVETNGSIPIAPFTHTPRRAAFTLDYKLPSSGMEAQMCLEENLAALQPEDCIKFVAGSMADLQRGAQLIRQYALCSRCHVYFSPVFGQIAPAEMVAFMKQEHLNDVRLQLQLHKLIWHPDQRGV
jgi:7-carboxy-7-deazaguanine synthase